MKGRRGTSHLGKSCNQTSTSLHRALGCCWFSVKAFGIFWIRAGSRRKKKHTHKAPLWSSHSCFLQERDSTTMWSSVVSPDKWQQARPSLRSTSTKVCHRPCNLWSCLILQASQEHGYHPHPWLPEKEVEDLAQGQTAPKWHLVLNSGLPVSKSLYEHLCFQHLLCVRYCVSSGILMDKWQRMCLEEAHKLGGTIISNATNNYYNYRGLIRCQISCKLFPNPYFS